MEKSVKVTIGEALGDFSLSCLEQTEIEVGLITLVYGANDAGKTLVIKEIIDAVHETKGKKEFWQILEEAKNRRLCVCRELDEIVASLNPVIFWEHPEIHLHPRSQRDLVFALVKIAKMILEKQGKFLMIETHSEIIVSSFLAQVALGNLTPGQLKCYLVKNIKGKVVVEEQGVTKQGQVDGGLSSFMEAELENLRAIMGIQENKTD